MFFKPGSLSKHVIVSQANLLSLAHPSPAHQLFIKSGQPYGAHGVTAAFEDKAMGRLVEQFGFRVSCRKSTFPDAAQGDG